MPWKLHIHVSWDWLEQRKGTGTELNWNWAWFTTIPQLLKPDGILLHLVDIFHLAAARHWRTDSSSVRNVACQGHGYQDIPASITKIVQLKSFFKTNSWLKDNTIFGVQRNKFTNFPWRIVQTLWLYYRLFLFFTDFVSSY